MSFSLRQPSASESSPHKYHKVAKKEKTRAQFLQKLGVKGSDVDIVEVSTIIMVTLYKINIARISMRSYMHFFTESRGSNSRTAARRMEWRLHVCHWNTTG